MNLVLFFIVATIAVSLIAFNNRSQVEKLIFEPYYMKNPAQWYRFISHGFIHADYQHLFFNMLSLYFAGTGCLYVLMDLKGPELGNVFFAVFYILALIVSSIPSYLRNKDNASYRSLGASGAVSSVLFFFIMFNPLGKILIPFPVWSWIFGIIYLISEYYLDKRKYGKVAHDAHFYGAIFGIIAAGVMYPQVYQRFFELIMLELGL